MKLKELLDTLYVETKIILTNKHGVYISSCNVNTFNRENNFTKYLNNKVIYIHVFDDYTEISIDRIRK